MKPPPPPPPPKKKKKKKNIYIYIYIYIYIFIFFGFWYITIKPKKCMLFPGVTEQPRFFETDNFDARRVVQGLPAEDAVVLKVGKPQKGWALWRAI